MNTPDLNAPRYRYDFKRTLTPEHIKKFKEKYPKYKDYDTKQLIKAISIYNELIYKEVIDYRDGIELPSTLGNIFIGMTGVPKKPIEAFHKSAKLGIKVFYKNHETDGMLSKIFYSNYGSKYKFANKQLWSFTATRKFKRDTSKEVRKNYKKYIIVNTQAYVSQLFNTLRCKHHMTQKTKEQFQTYDEFQLD